MRKLRVIPLVILLLFSFTASLNADEEIKLYLNGHEIYTDTPPQIINGRTMVPVRVIAENLGLGVDWDGSVRLTSDIPASNLEITVSDDDFKQVINEVLTKMDNNTRNYVVNYVREINDSMLPFIINPKGKACMSRNGVCSLNSVFFEKAKSLLSHEDLIYSYIGYITHEATHSHIYSSQMDLIYSSSDQENICDLAAVRAIERAGGYGTIAHTVFKEINWE